MHGLWQESASTGIGSIGLKDFLRELCGTGQGGETSATSRTKVRSLRYSESGGGSYGGQKQAGFLPPLTQASAVLVMKA